MFQLFENTVASIRRLRWQLDSACMYANSFRNPTYIKIYKEGRPGVTDSIDSDGAPKISRPRLVVENMKLYTPRETQYVMESVSIDMRGGLGPLLLKLPGEVRNMIYSDLLASGHPQFLRSSKAMHSEGIGLMAEKGIYRVHFGFRNWKNLSLPNQHVVDTIRNLDVCANLSGEETAPPTSGEFPDVWLLQAFGGPDVVRGQCNVLFEGHSSSILICVTRTCRSLRLLSEFQKIIVRIKLDWVSSTNGPRLVYSMLDAVWIEERNDVPAHWSDTKFRWIYDLIRRELERNLGKGHLGRDERGLRLVFYPRKALEGVENECLVEPGVMLR